MFRVEKIDGSGPYAGNEDNPRLAHMFAVHGDADHPQPWDDPLLEEIYPDEVCGFPTLCGLEEWFAGYEDVLTEEGYEIAVYTVRHSEVRFGKKQSLFVRGDAAPVRHMPMI